MEEKWNPDPKVIQRFAEQIKNSKECAGSRIAVGRRILTWEDLLQEVKDGTPLGRGYYQAMLES